MGKEWGFLVSEMWLLLAAAGFIGMFAGWIIWGGRQTALINATGISIRVSQKGKAL